MPNTATQREWDIMEVDAVIQLIRQEKWNSVSLRGFERAWERIKDDLKTIKSELETGI